MDETQDLEKRVQEALNAVQLGDFKDRYPSQLSGGQQQRAGICRALSNEPKIIFADEPTGNLDAYSAEQVMHYFTIACRKKGSSVLIVTHDAKVASYCDKIIFLRNGRIELEMERKSRENMSFYTSILDAQKEVLA